jgi:tRNA-Thr(GGU) m(6)t(6)A37 methyltransferase TsaA
MSFAVEPVAFVHASRRVPEDDAWGGKQARIVLADDLPPEALAGLASFSHVEVLFVFHGVPAEKVTRDARHPRNNRDRPKVGIFAQRGKNRPNRIGSTICRVVSVEGRTLTVAELDAIDGTPVIDIKPVMREFLPREAVRQPAWVSELMRDYWAVKD